MVTVFQFKKISFIKEELHHIRKLIFQINLFYRITLSKTKIINGSRFHLRSSIFVSMHTFRDPHSLLENFLSSTCSSFYSYTSKPLSIYLFNVNRSIDQTLSILFECLDCYFEQLFAHWGSQQKHVSCQGQKY